MYPKSTVVPLGLTAVTLIQTDRALTPRSQSEVDVQWATDDLLIFLHKTKVAEPLCAFCG